MVKCVHCKKYINEKIPTCPHCGAINVASVGGGEKIGATLQISDDDRLDNRQELSRRERFSKLGKDVESPLDSFGTGSLGADGSKSGSAGSGSHRASAKHGNRKSAGLSSGRLTIIVMIIFYLAVAVIPSAIRAINSAGQLGTIAGNEEKDDDNGVTSIIQNTLADYMARASAGKYYYAPDTEEIYYCVGLYYDDGQIMTEWWKYDTDNEEWFLSDEISGMFVFPDGLSGDDEYDLEENPDGLIPDGLAFDDIDIVHNTDYVDAGHHMDPDYKRYYEVDGKYYYYLDDFYRERVGKESLTGWYIYDQKAGWTWLCEKDDQDTLGDELWYRPNDYAICTQWSFSEESAKEWGITDFEETTYAKQVNEAQKEFMKTKKD